MNYHRLHKDHNLIKKDLIGKDIRCHIESIDTKNSIISISNKDHAHTLHVSDAFYELDSSGEYIELEVVFESCVFECIVLDVDHIKNLTEQ